MRRDRSRKPRRKVCSFCVDHAEQIDYKDVAKLRRFTTERGKILPRRISGVCAKHQRKLTVAIKRLRDKLEDDVQKPKYIKTVYGIGYTWAVNG